MKNSLINPFPEVVISDGKEWKKTPGYLNTYATKDGFISLLGLDLKLISVSYTKWKTTKGTYIYAKILDNDFKLSYKSVHGLVCSTFNGQPPSNEKNYEPNHKDGNKHNNRADNLEWVTRSENVQHAFDIGLCKVGVRIEAINVVTKEVRKYNTLSSMAKDWNIPRLKLRDILAKHRVKQNLYDGQWIFKIDSSSDRKLSRYQRVQVACKDYVTNDITICNDIVEASFKTGVNSGTIAARTNLNNKRKSRYSLISGCVFKRIDDDTPWPIYSKEEAILSRKKYKESNRTSDTIICSVKNYLTNEIMEFPSINKAVKHASMLSNNTILPTRITDYLSSGKLPIVYGFVFKDKKDNSPWPIFNNKDIELSMIGGRSPIEVNDVTLNTTKIYKSIPDFVKTIGKDGKNFEREIYKSISTQSLFLDRYNIKKAI